MQKHTISGIDGEWIRVRDMDSVSTDDEFISFVKDKAKNEPIPKLYPGDFVVSPGRDGFIVEITARGRYIVAYGMGSKVIISPDDISSVYRDGKPLWNRTL